MRTLLWQSFVAVAVLAVAAGAWIPALGAHTGPVATPRLSVPSPTGPHRVGTTSLHLVDDSRTDPLAPTPRVRELMVRLWYPAAPSRQPPAAYLTPGVGSAFTNFLHTATGVDLPTDLLSFPTNSLQDPPALPGARRPVVLFSHGLGVGAALNTALHEELASSGYVVAGIDHTFDVGAVEFPDGRVEVERPRLPGPIGFDRPFLMIGNQHERRTDDPDWGAFYDQLRGPRLHLVIDGAEHSDLTDITVFKSTIDISAVFPTGPIDGMRPVGIQRRHLGAWLDWGLRGRARPLLRGESARFPEVVFQP